MCVDLDFGNVSLFCPCGRKEKFVRMRTNWGKPVFGIFTTNSPNKNNVGKYNPGRPKKKATHSKDYKEHRG